MIKKEKIKNIQEKENIQKIVKKDLELCRQVLNQNNNSNNIQMMRINNNNKTIIIKIIMIKCSIKKMKILNQKIKINTGLIGPLFG